MPETKEKPFSFSIGADPEFILTMQGRKVDAQQTIDYMLSGKTGFEKPNNSMGFNVKPFGNIGWDGSSSTAEIRPKPSNDPKKVVNNLAGIFQAFAKHINIFDMSTISEFGPIGGHIHFEIPRGEKWTNDKKNTIHRKLASFYIPILVAENKTNLNLRIRQGYGSLKDHKIEEKFKYSDGSSGYTYEFRCPSAEWLTTPKLAAATLAYLATVYNEIVNHPKSFTKCNDIIYKSDKQGDALQTLTLMEYSLLTNNYIAKTRKYIKKFEMYETYKEEIEYIFNTKKVMSDKIKADYNIALGWKLGTTVVPHKRDVLSSDKKMKELATKNDFDQLKKVMNIHYNEDTNVALFAENLKDRVAAFNWKLKNNYYIFGIRKGIQNIVARNLNPEYIAGTKILKTVLDKHEMDKLFNKMETRFMDNNRPQNNLVIDFKTGKPKNTSESSIVIGIPYDMRVNKDIKPFLEFIWNLEKGTLKPEILVGKDAELLRDDRNISLEERGDVYRILTKQTENPTENVVFAVNTTSQRNHENAINDMIQEEAITGEQTPNVAQFNPINPRRNDIQNARTIPQGLRYESPLPRPDNQQNY